MGSSKIYHGHKSDPETECNATHDIGMKDFVWTGVALSILAVAHCCNSGALLPLVGKLSNPMSFLNVQHGCIHSSHESYCSRVDGIYIDRDRSWGYYNPDVFDEICFLMKLLTLLMYKIIGIHWHELKFTSLKYFLRQSKSYWDSVEYSCVSPRTINVHV